MQFTICNLTGEPISGYIEIKPKISAKFNILALRKPDAGPIRPSASASEFHLQPNLDFSTVLPKRCCKRIVFLNHEAVLPAQQAKLDTQPELVSTSIEKPANTPLENEGTTISISMGRNATWKAIPPNNESPWRMFLFQADPNRRKLMVLQSRNMASFLSQLPDRLPLSSLLLPGTHDTMAFYGWPISQCQTAPLSTQLKDGIRVIDVRLAVIPPPIRGAAPLGVVQNLIAYHGVFPQRTPFTSILNDVYQFLSSEDGRSETIVMSIKQEDHSSTPSQFFSEMVRNAVMAGSGGWDDSKTSTQGVNRGMWFLENRIPTLGEVRGKVILFSRFGGDGAGWPQGLEGLGIHPTTWPDSKKEGFEWVLKSTRVRTQDWYAIPSTAAMPEKFALGTANLLPPRISSEPILPITYFSGASFPLALPPTVAKGGVGVRGMNSLLGKWLLDQVGSIVPRNVPNAVANEPADGGQALPSSQIAHAEADNGQGAEQEPRIRGWAMLDYYDEPADARVVPLLVECNFLGRIPGEEGW